MIFKCVKLMQVPALVVLMWMCLSHSAIKPFVHFLVHFLLLLTIETLDVKDNMTFKCVKLVALVDLMWVCLSHSAIRILVHF